MEELFCAFCNRGEGEVKMLICNENQVCVCERCLQTCMNVIFQRIAEARVEPVDEQKGKPS